MRGALIRAMEAQREPLKARWETLLRAEPVRSPLANPEILTFKIGATLDEAFRRLRLFNPGAPDTRPEAVCECGLNPLKAYFSSGEIAMTEALLRAIPTVPGLSVRDRREVLGDLLEVWAQLCSDEVAVFCSFCRQGSPREPRARKNLKRRAVPGTHWAIRP